MPTIVGVKLRSVPKALWFDPVGTNPVVGDSVIVETERGTEIGSVLEAPREIESSALPAPLKPVTRVATEEDLKLAAELTAGEKAALRRFRELVKEHKLDMKPVDVEFLFGGDKVVFYFSAEERVDFRELVRQLATEFRLRIDMRQIGVRDEARMVGGLGHCGEQLCCVRFAGDFQPVSIRMAKEQDLPLNPLKISGLCGRLMCCLRYEFDAYKDFKSRAPKRGAMIDTPIGEGKVVDFNTPRETVTVRVPQAGSLTVPLSAMECCSGKGCPCKVSREALEDAGVSLPVLAASPSDRNRSGSSDSRPSRDRSAQRRPAEKAAEEVPKTDDAAKESRRSRGRGRPKSKGEQQPAARDEAAKAQPDSSSESKAAKPSSRRRRRRRPGGGSASGGTTE
ncbi:MAG: stage 0 sporulation family protein [Coriobacteriia bacterium]|nr:stage 0 sporulation family protein [Coriobacteriia bacterium]